MTKREMAELAAKEIAKEYGLELEYSNRIPIADIIESCGQDEDGPDLEHLAFSFVHGGFDPHGHGGCSCKECSWLRTRISAISRQEATEYFEAKYGKPAVETVQYIDGNLATEACEAAYKRACDTSRKCADMLRPAMLSILEAGWKVAKTSDLACGETAWVSVDTKLPERGEIVVMFSEHKALKMALPDLYWLGSYGVNEDNVLGWYDSGGDRVEGPGEEGFNVTHWQPLPSPPTGRTEGK